MPNNLENILHNVSPDVMYKQLAWLKKYFDIVEIDSLFNNSSEIIGKASITFDDAYKSVFNDAIPVIESLNIPCTIFFNGITLNQKLFWRDKIRFLFNNSMLTDFIECNSTFCTTYNINEKNFYQSTKHPKVNSYVFDNLLDEYFEKRKVKISELRFCIDNLKSIANHPLISYGNHTFNHYVLSSLNNDEQLIEIEKNHDILHSLNANISNVFSVPFGGQRDFN